MWIKQDKEKWCNMDYDRWSLPSTLLEEVIVKITDGRELDLRDRRLTLLSLFTWDTAPEGYSYWCDIDREVSLKIKTCVAIYTEKETNDNNTLSKYFGFEDGLIVYIKNTSNKYKEYLYKEGVFYGVYEHDGVVRNARLKTYTFLKNRGLDDKAIQCLLKELSGTKEYTYELRGLVEGYNDTEIGSCMQGNGDYFEALSECGKLLVAYEEDKQVGRAIVWNKENLDGLPEIYKGLMDRIYPSENHEIVKAFKKYAREHKLLTRMEQNYRTVMKFDNEENLRLVLNCGSLDGQLVPYMDTFKYYNEQGYLHNDSDINYDYELTNTDGNTLVGTYCEHCDTTHRGDTVYVEGYGDVCEDCLDSSDFFHCDSCGEYFRTIRTSSNELLNGDTICQGCLENGNYVFSDYHDKYIDGNDSVYSEQDDCYYCDNDNLNYSDYSCDYSMNENLVEVVVSKTVDTENWFECEASSCAYYDEENDTYYKTHDLYMYINDIEIKGNEDEQD